MSINSDIPSSWANVEIEEILEPRFNSKTIQQGWSPRCERFPSEGSDKWGVLKTTAIQEGEFLSDENKQLPEHLDPREKIEVQVGDIVMTCAGPRNRCGVACLVSKTRPKLMMSGKMYRFRPVQNHFNSKYLQFVLHSQEAKKAIDRMKTGINDSGLNLTHDRFRQLLVPVAPKNEQDRIVAKIEELFSELDKGIESLKTAREQLKVYRQALLKHAFEGKLTEQWRKENADKLETADQLLERIKQAREARYQQQLEEWKAVVKQWEADGKDGKKPSKPSKPKQIEAISEEENAYLFGLAVSHSWQRFGNLYYESVLGKMLDKKKNKGEPKPYLRNVNVRWGSFDLSDIFEMRFEESELPRYTVSKGDLVICEGGEPGRCSVWNHEEHEFLIQKALHRVRLIKEVMSPDYIQHFIKFSAEQGILSNYFTGTTIKHLTGASLAKLPIPLMPIDEQHFIVDYLDEQSSYCDRLDSDLEDNIAKSEALRQSILKKAFSGQLVPQDPDDEPASALLERIAKEKEEVAAKAKKAKAAKKKPKTTRTSTRKAS